MSPEDEQKRQTQTDRNNQNTESRQRRPYDSSEIDNIPRPTDDDPPYRSWWVARDANAAQ